MGGWTEEELESLKRYYTTVAKARERRRRNFIVALMLFGLAAIVIAIAIMIDLGRIT